MSPNFTPKYAFQRLFFPKIHPKIHFIKKKY